MSATHGIDCKLYRNTASWAAPTWSEIDVIRSMTLPMTRDKGDASTRGDTFKAYVAGLIDAPLTGEALWDPSDAGFAALLDAFIAKTTVELAILDGASDAAGSEGLHADVYVTKCERQETMDGAVLASLEFAIAKTANAAAWMTVAS